MQVIKIKKYRMTLLVIFFMLSGCMVGPDFHSPPFPQVHSYTERPLPKKTVSTPSAGKAGHAQTFIHGADIPSEWWYVFHSPALNCLIMQGLANNATLEAAYAALRSAQEALTAQIGNSFFPAINAGLSASRQRASGAPIGLESDSSSIFGVYNASVNVAYTLDLFGGLRRQVESLRAQVDYQQFQLIAAYLTLTANIVTTAVTAASYEAQIQATHDLVRAQTRQLNILKQQLRLGGISRDTVLTQETLVDQTRATLPGLEKNMAQQRHALAVLVGQFPSRPLPHISLDSLNLPKTLPVSVPCSLVRQRPDVRASEALLHSASASIGVATANLFPQLNITGNYGWEADTPSKLFSAASKTWMMTAALTQPVFHGGALFALRRQAIANFDQAEAIYRQTVLTAFQNVADTLRALETDARNLREQKRAEKAAWENLQLAQNQYSLGGANYLSLLNAQRQYQTIRLAVIQAKALRYNDTAALFQALGGGWWHKNWCVKECLDVQ